MSVRKIHLRKLLRYFYLADAPRRTLLREDIRTEISKEAGLNAGGGDFHIPFWTDAKSHVAGFADLRTSSKSRIEKNERRRRLYPLLTDGFLGWWNEKRRWRNEKFSFIEEDVHGWLPVPEVGGIVKIENLLALKIGDQTNRIIYPYFAEVPALPQEGARIGLWALAQGLANYVPEDLRILDVLRGTSFATRDNPLVGDERDLFLRKYKSLLKEWDKLREEY